MLIWQADDWLIFLATVGLFLDGMGWWDGLAEWWLPGAWDTAGCFCDAVYDQSRSFLSKEQPTRDNANVILPPASHTSGLLGDTRR